MDAEKIFISEIAKVAVEGGGEHQHFAEKTIHDKTKSPSKVKEIFRAVKRDHPEYPAEYKARIAFKKGNKAKEDRKEGPPYEGPLAGK